MHNASSALPTAAKTAGSQLVVQDYLDMLLREVMPSAVKEEPAAGDPQEIPGKVSQPHDPAASVKPAVSEPVVEIEATGAAAQESPAEPLSPAKEQVRELPLWAQKPFASLLFDVAGLQLAAPLHELGGIMPIEDKLQPIVAQADWFMGLLRWNGRTLRVVDTARFVMPERAEANDGAEYHTVVILGNSNWALAVNHTDQSVNLSPADVRWRRTLGKRPWLAGTVLNRLCALLDIDVLVSLLDNSDAARQLKDERAPQAPEGE